MSVQILRPVSIKAKVTESLKVRLAAEIQEALRSLEDEMQQLDTQVKRAQLTASMTPQQQMQLRQFAEVEKAKRTEKQHQLEEERKAIQGLPLGSEILQGTAQSIATIDIGSSFDTLTAMEIVIEDGKVIAIRQGSD